ncbi:hypothetical protein EDC01DRAFT_56059 [Geopyxis carbonaria]|nr:hypothetical protein EDC01DRAFT_56059 [Geopyxis carbonaria]
MATITSERLQLLEEHIRLSLIERKRALSSNTEPDGRNTHEISRSLDTFHQGIEQLEREQRQLENTGDLSSGVLREREDVLIRLRTQYDDLQAQFSSETFTSHTDSPGLPMDNPAGHRGSNSFDEFAARDALMGSRELLNGTRKSNKTVRFRDSLVDTEEMNSHQVLQLHNRVMEEQDESLDRLSQSIRNQRELSIQIGDELESHVQLLDEVDDLVDRHQSRMHTAKRKLDNVARTAKDHGSLVIIAILIVILILLIVILK